MIKGYKQSKEHKQNISNARKGKGFPTPFIKGHKINLGRKFTEEHRKKLGKKSSNHPMWKGGEHITIDGYVNIHKPNHPFNDCKRYVKKHRIIIEEQIKRFLKPEEACHHINKIKDDNRPENLMAFKTQSAHNSFEAGNPIDPSDIIFDGHKFHAKLS